VCLHLFFIKLPRRQVTGKDGLGDDIGRFGVADQAQGLEFSFI
jgi:hypothetical protein